MSDVAQLLAQALAQIRRDHGWPVDRPRFETHIDERADKIVSACHAALSRLTIAAITDPRESTGTPGDIVILLNLLASMVENQGMDMILLQMAQIATLQQPSNNTGMTYGCLRAEEAAGETMLPMTVVIFCNRKSMPTSQIAEFILREGEGTKPHLVYKPQ